MNNNKFVSLFLGLLVLSSGITSRKGLAQTLTVGAQVGGVGGVGSDSGIAWGANLNVNSFGWASFYSDIIVSPLTGGTLVAVSPAFAFYPVDADGFLFGGMVGVGFYSVPADNTTFGFNYGLIGDFAISRSLSIGMTARQHILTGSGNTDSMWNVMMSLGYKLEGGGDW